MKDGAYKFAAALLQSVHTCLYGRCSGAQFNSHCVDASSLAASPSRLDRRGRKKSKRTLLSTFKKRLGGAVSASRRSLSMPDEEAAALDDRQARSVSGIRGKKLVLQEASFADFFAPTIALYAPSSHYEKHSSVTCVKYYLLPLLARSV